MNEDLIQRKKTFKVKITATVSAKTVNLEKIVEVEAKNQIEALNIVKDNHSKEGEDIDSTWSMTNFTYNYVGAKTFTYKKIEDENS